MAADRKVQRTSAPAERRPAITGILQRSAAPAPASAARTLQERLGHQATQALIARSIGVAAPVSTQLSSARRLPANVSKPTDPAELEAEETARKVMRMSQPSAAAPVTPKRTTEGVAQRAESAPSSGAITPTPSPIAHAGAGSPLPSTVRSHMEPRFGANFGDVRVHTGESAAQDSAALDANAFTIGQHIYFGRDKFQPQSAGGQELIAHELTHTIQQGAAVQSDITHRHAHVPVAEHVSPHPQRSWYDIPSPREYFAGKAAAIPGFTMLTVVIGYNPITNAKVERNAGNILRAAIQMIPGGTLITDALNSHGVFDAVSLWVSKQFETLKDIGSSIWQDVENFIKGFSLSDLTDLAGLWERAKAIVMRPADRVIAFAKSLKDDIVAFIKRTILGPIAAYARTTQGYTLLATVMGKDPITGEPVARDAESLLGAFLTFIGEDELWATMQKTKAVARAFAWFTGAVAALKGFVNEIPALFTEALKSLDVADIILIPRAFLKLAGVFGDFAVRFVNWGGNAVWTLLEIIFDVVSPGALVYIKKTGAALRRILRDPLPFVGNLVKAAKLGFNNFSDRFVDHLKEGIIDWLTGSLPGIYMPKAFSLVEIAKFAFSVLGLTWANIRQKLVTATSETVVKTLETGFALVVTLVRDGPAAAWDLIKEQLANLKDMVIGGITDFVLDMVAKKAIPKLISLFIPGAGFISAILSIYDTIMVFVNKIKQIVQVVSSFVDSIAAIAEGQIDAAAERVESALAGALSLAINFLAGFVGLGKVADKVMGVIDKIRKPIDKALDWLVNWIVTAAKKLGAFAAEKAGDVLDWWKEKLGFTNKAGETHTLQFIGAGDSAKLGIATTLTPVRDYLDQHPDKGTPDWNTADSVFTQAMQVVFGHAKKSETEQERRANIKKELAKVSAAFIKLGGTPPTDADYGSSTTPTYKNPAAVEVIVGKPVAGSKTGPWPQTRAGYKEVYDAQLTTATDPWVQMHIISEQLGGSGTDFDNLVPAPNSVNTGPFRSFEHNTVALAAAKAGAIRNRIWVEVQISGPKHAATGLVGKTGLYFWRGAKASPKWLKNETPSFSVSAPIPVPQLKGTRKLVLNFTSGTEMQRDFGLSASVASLVKEGRPYGSVAQFQTKMKTNGATTAQINAVLSRGPVLD